MAPSNNSETEMTMEKVLTLSPELTSHGLGWQDINVEYYSQPAGETLGADIPYHILAINAGSAYDYESRVDDRYCRGTFAAGNISLYPALQRMPYRWHRDTSILYVNLSQELLVRNAIELLGCDRVELCVTHSSEDKLLQQLGLALKANLEPGSMESAVYAQTMANAIAVHLLKNYATKRHNLPQIKGGLSPQKQGRVLLYIDDNLEQKISLADLAAIAQLSQHHFARAFKQSLGSSPHQYLIQTRVLRAQQLLKNTDLEINEVAIACGFSNQSHLCRHFKKQTGITPKQFALKRKYL